MKKISRWLKAAADILAPRTCIVCEDRLNLDEERLCLHCLAGLPMTYFWSRHHNIMADRFNEMVQKRCCDSDSWEERYIYATALFFYSEDTSYRNILLGLKYHGDTWLGIFFGRMLGKRMASCSWFCDVDAIVPVPLHWRRRWTRGYNQAEVIAGELASVLGAEMKPELLRRIRSTRTQTKLDVKDKTENVSGGFRAFRSEGTAAPERLTEGHILIVDDVFTTGSTVLACFSALREILPPTVRISIATLGFVGQ